MDSPASAAAQILGARLRERRTSLELSQEDVAHMSAMHVSNFGKIERGLANPNLHTLLRIASVLEVDPGVLIAGLSGDMVTARPHKLTAAELIRARQK
jgi:transcriptional regulator with XRE-family HTH domain